ncbi:MAG: DUF58 domain-containing protein [Acidobacteriota bacterium]
MRITKVGLWYVVFVLITGLAATNTGNNALYMTLAALLGAGVMSAIVGLANVRRLEAEVLEGDEIYARSPATAEVTLRQRGAFPAWMLMVHLEGHGRPTVIGRLGKRGSADALQHCQKELLFMERGKHRIESLTLSSLYPLGLLRVTREIPARSELIVFPQLFEAAALGLSDGLQHGEDSVDRPGRGHELHSLRDFRAGDDPRHMHWKQTARTGDLILQELQTEESRRLSVVLDNALPEGQTTESARARFEQLVSEAATASVDYLDRGYEVELVLRGKRLGFGSGQRQRRAILEALALVQPSTREEPLEEPRSGAPRLRFTLAGEASEPERWSASA